MDGDQRMKQHEKSMSRSGNVSRRAPGRATDRFDPAMQPRGDPTGMSQAPLSYDYGYTGSSFHGGSLQSSELQNYQPQDFVRAQRSQQAPSIQPRRRVPPQGPAAFSYDSSMLYGFGQPGPTQGPFEVVPQYPTRQSAAIDVLSNQFAVPQYFAPEETAGSGVAGLSPFLNAQLQPYNQSNPMARPNTSQSFSAPISDFTAIGSGSMNRLDQPQAEPQNQPSDQPSLEEAIGRYQRILCRTFDQTRAGRLVEAGESLLEISEWLVTNARDLGLLNDDSVHYSDRLKLWSDFNLCWLAICQKQKDLILGIIATNQQSPHVSLLRRDRMENMGRDLIQLCDQLEPHGLVDYQMGIWEEEILSVLGQCLDLMESRPELHHMPALPEPTAVARP